MPAMSHRFASLKPLALFWRYWLRYPKLLIGAFCIGPVLAVQNVVTPLFVAIALSELVRTGHVNPAVLIAGAITLLVALCAGYVINNRFDAYLEHRVENTMYNDVFRYLVYQDYDFFANNFRGSIVTKANRLVKSYSLFHVTFFLEILPQLCGVLFALGVMLYYSLALGGSIIVLWLVSTALITYLALKRMPLRRMAVAQDSVQTGELADVVTNAVAVKTFAAETTEIDRYARTNISRGNYFLRSWKRAIVNGWVVEVLCAILQLLVFIGGILAVEHHRLSLPIFLLFQVYILRVVDSLRRTNQFVRTIEGVLGDAIEMTELLEQPPIVQDAAGSKRLHITEGNVLFHDVTFAYRDNRQKESLFAQLNLEIGRDKKVGLVGPSGGGKTTITKLLLRFMDVQGGSISIDGHDIRDIRQADLRSAIAYVPQEPLLFHRSIRENIGYGKPGATDEEIVQAARQAYADDFIQELPAGYDTLVGERGVKLSGGQRQRIAIARAMLKDAPILVLDEATSALDSDSERLIQKALEKLMSHRTVLVIAHRLSTINKLDRIVVLDDGKIVEDGRHEQLLEQGGLYAKLWAHQSGGFIED